MSSVRRRAESLPEKIVGLHRAFGDHGIPYGFGGAIALAYHAEPRATDDIDVNILLPPASVARVLSAVASAFTVEDLDEHLRAVAAQDQTRLLWGST